MSNNSDKVKNILIVDDEELILDLYSDFFEQKGFSVRTGMNLREAMDIIEKHHHELDLILADIMLPDGKGFQIHDELEKNNFDIPIIFMTGFRYKPEIANKLKELDANWLSKPIKMEELFDMVNDIYHSTNKE
ncbi:MAG: response regulator [Candidatus Marinimicrobia bacterium]|nr:response regulator [Candidatus Neomarinimicrobiota bacterium]